jgi:hypothetical protein
VQVTLAGEAFDRLDLRPLGFDGEDQAAIHRQAVEQDRAGPAVAVVAAFLRARQAERIAEDFQQALAGFTEEFGGLAVDGRGDVMLFRHGLVSGQWSVVSSFS